MTKRNATHILSPFTNNGYILDLTKNQLADLVFELTQLELEDFTQLGESNSKRLIALLVDHPEHADIIVDALIKHKEQL